MAIETICVYNHLRVETGQLIYKDLPNMLIPYNLETNSANAKLSQQPHFSSRRSFCRFSVFSTIDVITFMSCSPLTSQPFRDALPIKLSSRSRTSELPRPVKAAGHCQYDGLGKAGTAIRARGRVYDMLMAGPKSTGL